MRTAQKIWLIGLMRVLRKPATLFSPASIPFWSPILKKRKRKQRHIPGAVNNHGGYQGFFNFIGKTEDNPPHKLGKGNARTGLMGRHKQAGADQ